MGNPDKLISAIKVKKYGNKYQNGHLWIFSNELVEVPQHEPGTVIDVIAADDARLGLAFYNPNSLISLRLLLAHSINKLNEILIQRIIDANDRRLAIFSNSTIYRMVFGESDFLPGLIIDRYGDYYAVQIQSAGFERLKTLIIDAILQINPATKGIILKSNSKSRETEGLSTEDEILFGKIPEIITINDDNFRFNLNLSQGQKTGYFLDQRYNRTFIKQIAQGKSVLDCFTNIGAFALSAAAGGATNITGVDISDYAIGLARQNAKLNMFDINFVCDDVFDFLQKNFHRKWDIIVLDPPAFAKNKKSIPTAKAAYTKLNKIAFSMLSPWGILLTASCSYHIYEDVFYSLVLDAAKKASVKINLIYRGFQAPDHPIYPPMPETSYLKFFAFQVVKTNSLL